MLLSGRNQPLAELSLAEGFDALHRAGADAVELCHEHPAMSPEKASPEQAAGVAEMLADAGIRASAVGWHCDYVLDDANYERLPELIALTPLYGTDVFITACVKSGEGAWERALERTGVLCEAAEQAGVRLAIEYEPNFLVEDSASLLRLVKEVGSDALAANLDLGHAFLMEDDPAEGIRSLGDRIAHCHVEGMAEGTHKHLLPWEGDLPLEDCFSVLQEVGFDGALALDLYGVDYAAVAPKCFDYLRGLLPG